MHPDTFKALPVWAPHKARGRPLYNATWTRQYANTSATTGQTSYKFEENVAALDALVAAIGVARPKPKNWTVCYLWRHDNPSFAQRSSVMQDLRYFSCVANMVWLPTSLKGFTDTLPEIKAMLRVCAFHLYGWAYEHESVQAQAEQVRSGLVPEQYPRGWPAPDRPGLFPPGTASFTSRVKYEVEKLKAKVQAQLATPTTSTFPGTTRSDCRSLRMRCSTKG